MKRFAHVVLQVIQLEPKKQIDSPCRHSRGQRKKRQGFLGSTAGIFVHERHANNPELPRFAGWWGTPPDERFLMKKGFVPDYGADGWMLSNAPVLAMAVQNASLDIYLEAGRERLIKKQLKLTAYLEFVLKEVSKSFDSIDFEIITPKERGSQLSILTHGSGKRLL